MSESELMICDGEKSIGIAGIMGGHRRKPSLHPFRRRANLHILHKSCRVGVESCGMMCSIEELGSTRDMYPEAPESGIYIFKDDVEVFYP